MKPILAILLAFPLFVQAQLTKGTWFTGGSASFSDQNSANNFNSFGVSPKLGYVLSDKWAVGLTLGYSATHETESPYVQSYSVGQTYLVANKNNTSTFSSGIFARRFFLLSDKFFFAVEGSVNFSRSNSTDVSTYTPDGGPGTPFTTNTDAPSYSVGALARPLFVFFPTNRWGLEAGFGSLSFTHQHNLAENSTTAGQNSVGFLVSSSTALSIFYYFNRK